MRSRPGEGRPVLIYVLGDDRDFADDLCRVEAEGNCSVIWAGLDEDYSTCHWPVVVKVREGYSADYVADRLEDLVRSLRREGLRAEVPDELPDYALRLARVDADRLGSGELDVH